MPSVPSVTMKGSIRPLVISRPCASPNRPPSTSANSAPSSTMSTGEATCGSSAFIARITLPAISAAIEPTDRSMPPPMITKLMPIAMIPMNAVRVSTFMALSQVAKPGLSKVPAMQSAIRPTSGPRLCARCLHAFDLAARRAPASGGAIGAMGASPAATGVLVGAGRMGDQSLFGQSVGIERRLDLAGAHDHHPMAKPDQLDQLRGDDDHAAPFGRQALDQEIDVALGPDVDATGRLVEHDHPRAGLQHLRDGQLLLVAARKLRCADGRVAGADAEVADRLLQGATFRRRVEPGPRVAVEVHQREVFQQREAHVQSLALAVFAEVGEAVARSIPRAAKGELPASQLHVAGAARPEAEQALEQFRPTGAHQACEPDNLAGGNVEAHGVRPAGHAESAHLQQGLAGPGGLLGRKHVGDFAADHQVGHLMPRDARGRYTRRETAVAHHDDLVGDALDLVELVR